MFTNVTLLYFLLLIPLSGLIAWLGDRIGHKTGKRRHTLFGLRPRHTAMVFTIGTGMCISFVSFALMFCLSAAFRTVVSEGFRLVETNRQLKESNLSLAVGNRTLSLKADRRRLEAEKADTQRDFAVRQRDLALRQETQAEGRVKLADENLKHETQSLLEAQIDLRKSRLSLASVKGSLKDKNTHLQLAELQVADATRRVADARRQAEDAEANVDHVRKVAQMALTEQRVQQESALADLHKQLDDQNALFNAQKSKTEEQKQNLALLNQQIIESQHALDESQLALDKIRVSSQALREHQITYQVGEEIDRVAIRPGINIWRIESLLTSFLATAGKRPRHAVRGAIRIPSGRSLFCRRSPVATSMRRLRRVPTV